MKKYKSMYMEKTTHFSDEISKLLHEITCYFVPKSHYLLWLSFIYFFLFRDKIKKIVTKITKIAVGDFINLAFSVFSMSFVEKN